MSDPGFDLTQAEREELESLRSRKAWRAPRYLVLDAKARQAATTKWRRADVFGDSWQEGDKS